MKIFLTGSTGYIGSNLLRLFQKEGHDVFHSSRGTMISNNISSFRPDVIVNCAAEIYDESKMFDSNFLLTRALVKTGEGCGVKGFVQIGSSAEYGRVAKPIAETDLLNPRTMYEVTKATASILVNDSKLSTIVARPFSVYGRNEPLRRFIPIVWDAYKNKKKLKVTPWVHDFIHIDDFTRGVMMCVQRVLDQPGHFAFNFGTGVQHSNPDVVRTFEKVLQEKIDWEPTQEPMRLHESDFWCCNTQYCKKELDFQSEIDFETGIRMYIEQMELGK